MPTIARECKGVHVVGKGDRAVNKTNPCPQVAHILMGGNR